MLHEMDGMTNKAMMVKHKVACSVNKGFAWRLP